MDRTKSLRLTSALAALLLAAAAAAPATETNRIVLRVNGRIATLYDYEQLKAKRMATLAEMPPERREQLLADLGRSTLRDIYEELLVLSRADQLGVRIRDQEIDEAVEFARANSGVETREEFLEGLASIGMTMEDLREEMRKNLTIRQVMGREVQGSIDLEEEDLRRYYQSHAEDYGLPVRLELRETVVLEEATTEEERARIAEEIRTAIAAGSAEELVERYADQGLTTTWIEIGWVEPGDLARELEAAVWELGSGEVSQPVAARGGLHVVQVLDRKEAEQRSFAEVRDEIEDREYSRLFQEEIGKYMRQLERSSYIVAQPPPEAADFRTFRRMAPPTGGLEGLDRALVEGGEEAEAAAEEPSDS